MAPRSTRFGCFLVGSRGFTQHGFAQTFVSKRGLVRFDPQFRLGLCLCLRSMRFGFSSVRPALFFRFASGGPAERLPQALRASLRSLCPLAPPQHRAETKRVFSICAKACL